MITDSIEVKPSPNANLVTLRATVCSFRKEPLLVPDILSLDCTGDINVSFVANLSVRPLSVAQYANIVHYSRNKYAESIPNIPVNISGLASYISNAIQGVTRGSLSTSPSPPFQLFGTVLCAHLEVISILLTCRCFKLPNKTIQIFNL